MGRYIECRVGRNHSVEIVVLNLLVEKIGQHRSVVGRDTKKNASSAFPLDERQRGPIKDDFASGGLPRDVVVLQKVTVCDERVDGIVDNLPQFPRVRNDPVKALQHVLENPFPRTGAQQARSPADDGGNHFSRGNLDNLGVQTEFPDHFSGDLGTG